MVFFEEGDFRHFSLEIGSILEEVASMRLIELIPYFLTTVDHFLIFFFCDYGLIFGELSDCFLFHLFSEFIENDMLFGSPILIEFYLSPYLFLGYVFLHC